MFGALALLARVPWWTWPAAAVLGWGWWQSHSASTAREAAKEAQNRAVEATARADGEASAREAEKRLLEAQKRINDAALKRSVKAAATAASASAAAERVLDDVRRLVASAGSPASAPGAVTPGEAAAALGDVLGRCVTRHRELAKEADAARDAGIVCEQSYDQLKSFSTGGANGP